MNHCTLLLNRTQTFSHFGTKTSGETYIDPLLIGWLSWIIWQQHLEIFSALVLFFYHSVNLVFPVFVFTCSQSSLSHAEGCDFRIFYLKTQDETRIFHLVICSNFILWLFNDNVIDLSFSIRQQIVSISNVDSCSHLQVTVRKQEDLIFFPVSLRVAHEIFPADQVYP